MAAQLAEYAGAAVDVEVVSVGLDETSPGSGQQVASLFEHRVESGGDDADVAAAVVLPAAGSCTDEVCPC